MSSTATRARFRSRTAKAGRRTRPRARPPTGSRTSSTRAPSRAGSDRRARRGADPVRVRLRAGRVERTETAPLEFELVVLTLLVELVGPRERLVWPLAGLCLDPLLLRRLSRNAARRGGTPGRRNPAQAGAGRTRLSAEPRPRRAWPSRPLRRQPRWPDIRTPRSGTCCAGGR